MDTKSNKLNMTPRTSASTWSQAKFPMASFYGKCFVVTAALLSGASFVQAQKCPAPSSWFPHEKTSPPDPATFPQDANDCDFHQWAWQTFLYLTQDDGGQARFLSYPTDADLFPADPAQKPAKSTALKAQGTKAPIKLRVRSAKPRASGVVENPNGISQAGSEGVLVAQDGNPVFYSIHFNPTFYDFVESNGYYDYSTYTQANPSTNFPPGALELKASWMIVPSGYKGSAYTINAQVPTLYADPNAPTGVSADPSKPRNVTVALVGLHVVGVVANHPEFIWATFENSANAPDLPASLQPSSTQPVSSKAFTFYQASTPANQCNVQATALTLNKDAQTVSPVTQVFRQYRDGGGVPENIQAIDTLNASVSSQLASTDVWKNYNLIGGVWLLPGVLQPGLSPTTSDLHGSAYLANSTMETFVQPPFTPPNSTLQFTSCLGCHTAAATSIANTGPSGLAALPIPAMNMNLSHTLTDGLVTRQVKLQKLKAVTSTAPKIDGK